MSDANIHIKYCFFQIFVSYLVGWLVSWWKTNLTGVYEYQLTLNSNYSDRSGSRDCSERSDCCVSRGSSEGR